jgi:hypothetical protein
MNASWPPPHSYPPHPARNHRFRKQNQTENRCTGSYLLHHMIGVTRRHELFIHFLFKNFIHFFINKSSDSALLRAVRHDAPPATAARGPQNVRVRGTGPRFIAARRKGPPPSFSEILFSSRYRGSTVLLFPSPFLASSPCFTIPLFCFSLSEVGEAFGWLENT